MNISACLVTRGDVDLEPILASLPMDDVVVWDNSKREDLSVYGRYAAIAEAKHPLIYVQDDDCVLPTESIERLFWESDSSGDEYGRLVCNMPEPFRKTYYQRHALVGFGAVFHRSLPFKAFNRFCGSLGYSEFPQKWPAKLLRTCDVVFTALTPYAIFDVPYENLSWANASYRMYHQEGHVQERLEILGTALAVLTSTDGAQ